VKSIARGDVPENVSQGTSAIENPAIPRNASCEQRGRKQHDSGLSSWSIEHGLKL
jgi:hypothetical protein